MLDNNVSCLWKVLRNVSNIGVHQALGHHFYFFVFAVEETFIKILKNLEVVQEEWLNKQRGMNSREVFIHSTYTMSY